MYKHNLVINVAPPKPTWRDQARRVLNGPPPKPVAVEVRFTARPAAWEGRIHLEGLARDTTPVSAGTMTPDVVGDLGRSAVAA